MISTRELSLSTRKRRRRSLYDFLQDKKGLSDTISDAKRDKRTISPSERGRENNQEGYISLYRVKDNIVYFHKDTLAEIEIYTINIHKFYTGGYYDSTGKRRKDYDR